MCVCTSFLQETESQILWPPFATGYITAPIISGYRNGTLILGTAHVDIAGYSGAPPSANKHGKLWIHFCYEGLGFRVACVILLSR